MRKVEKQLRILGISVPRGTLSFAVAYGILNGTDMESEVRTIADWMRNPQNQQPWPPIDSILFLARRAERQGVKPAETWRDYLSSKLKTIAVVVISILASVVALINGVLTLLARLHP